MISYYLHVLPRAAAVVGGVHGHHAPHDHHDAQRHQTHAQGTQGVLGARVGAAAARSPPLPRRLTHGQQLQAGGDGEMERWRERDGERERERETGDLKKYGFCSSE